MSVQVYEGDGVRRDAGRFVVKLIIKRDEKTLEPGNVRFLMVGSGGEINGRSLLIGRARVFTHRDQAENFGQMAVAGGCGVDWVTANLSFEVMEFE